MARGAKPHYHQAQTKRLSMKLMPSEHHRLVEYCERNNISIADLVRDRLKDVLRTSEPEDTSDPSQTKIDID